MADVTLKWRENMVFDAYVNGFNIALDAQQEGKQAMGPSPKPLLLVSLAGCTGMDIVSLAAKMRVGFSSFSVDAHSETSQGDHPHVYTSFKVIYRFEGEGVDPSKPMKMVTLSQEKYCGVAEMMRRIAPLTFEVYLNGELIDDQGR